MLSISTNSGSRLRNTGLEAAKTALGGYRAAMLDLVVIGAGVVGSATAMRYLARFPGHSVLLLEKEAQPGEHQSGHNSGVLHSGLVYAPGSAKALHCRRGKQRLEEHCTKYGIPHERCGKLIIATSEAQLPRLAALRERAQRNGVETRDISAAQIHTIEPAAAGIAALHVPGTGIVDYRKVVASFREQIESAGGELRTGARVVRIEHEGDNARVEVAGAPSTILARRVIGCAGLQADRLALASRQNPDVRIVPFLGEYRALRAQYRDRIRGLIYPVADPRLPFLGVHLTRRIDGGVDCGPNALPTFAREGYARGAFDARDFFDLIRWPGAWRLGVKQIGRATGELWRSLSIEAFARDLARLCPELRADWLEPAPAGVRAQAVERDGSLVDDFRIESSGCVVHVLNAPSPAATSSLEIAEALVDRCVHPR